MLAYPAIIHQCPDLTVGWSGRIVVETMPWQWASIGAGIAIMALTLMDLKLRCARYPNVPLREHIRRRLGESGYWITAFGILLVTLVTALFWQGWYLGNQWGVWEQVGRHESEFLERLHEYQDQRRHALWADIAVWSFALLMLYAISSALWTWVRRRGHVEFWVCLRQAFSWGSLLAVILTILPWGYVFEKTVREQTKREQFKFIPVGTNGSFMTLALFTDLRDHVVQNESGTLHVYARIYYSRPSDATIDRLDVISPSSTDFALREIQRSPRAQSPFGPTHGVDDLYEYVPSALGEYTLLERIWIHGQPSPVENVESTNVVKQASLSFENVMDSPVWDSPLLRYGGPLGQISLLKVLFNYLVRLNPWRRKEDE